MSRGNKTNHKTRSLAERFWVAKVDIDDCWIWRGAHTSYGYGVIKMRDKTLYAHRVMWELTYGPIPDYLCVLHHCDNPPCVRPDHLFLGTRKNNAFDCIQKKRNPIGENNGRAKLTSAQALEIRNSKLSSYKLASKYRVSRWTIQNIKKGIV